MCTPVPFVALRRGWFLLWSFVDASAADLTAVQELAHNLRTGWRQPKTSHPRPRRHSALLMSARSALKLGLNEQAEVLFLRSRIRGWSIFASATSGFRGHFSDRHTPSISKVNRTRVNNLRSDAFDRRETVGCR